jgi:hypothetical protein
MKKILVFIFATSVALFGEIILEAKGWGSSKVDAQDSAIASLSSIIISQIDSKFEKSETVSNKMVEKRVNYKLAVTSKTILKGVEYIDLGKNKGKYISKAIFSRKALNDTIEYLYQIIKSAKPRSMSRDDLKRQLEYVEYLKPLLGYLNKKELRDKLHNFVENREVEFLKNLNQAHIKFNVIPEDATISIGNDQYDNFESIFLNGGKYRYVIKRKGYYPENGQIAVSSGEKTVKNISLVKETSGGKIIEIKTDDPDYQQYFAEALRMYEFSIGKSENRIEITTSEDFVMDLDGMKFYNYMVEAKIYKNGKFLKSKRAKLKNKTKSIIKQKKSKIAQALTKAIFSERSLKDTF